MISESQAGIPCKNIQVTKFFSQPEGKQSSHGNHSQHFLKYPLGKDQSLDDFWGGEGMGWDIRSHIYTGEQL